MEAVKAEALSTEQPRLDPLTARALDIVTGNLRRFGNELSAAHIDELRNMLRGMSELARGKRKGRFAYALDCGLGKTQAVVALYAAIHELGRSTISVAISASQVEALCQLKRDLIDNGVPAQKVGLIHSYRHDAADPRARDGYASLPKTDDNDQRQFQLVSHQRVKGGRANLDQYARYKGVRRSLLVYDESLFISEPSVLNAVELEQAWGWVKPKLKRRRRDDPVAQRAYGYLEVAIEVIQMELERQERTHTRAEPIELEQLTAEDIGTLKATLGGSKIVAPLKQLLEMSQERLRAVHTGHLRGEGLVTYDVTVPAELENIAVLDASFPIRMLERLDDTIVPGLPERSEPVKSYEQVTIHHLKTASGRGSVTEDFSSKDGSKFLLELVHLVKNVIPADEAVILFTFKPRASWDGRGRYRDPVDFAQRIKTALREVGGDPEATVIDRDGKVQPRLVIVTWGNETSTSHWSYCTHVVFAGVMHRDHLDLASYLVGQRNDLWAHVDRKQLTEAMQTEAAHCVYQAIMRAAARVVELINGHTQALRTDIWLPYPNETLRPWLSKVMPRVKWARWSGTHITARLTQHAALEELIRDALAGLPAEQIKVSIKALWELRPEFAGFPPRTRNRVLADMLEDVQGSLFWVREGRSLIRDNLFENTLEPAQQLPEKIEAMFSVY